MNKFMAKGNRVDLCSKFFQFHTDVLDVPIPRPFETTIRNEIPYLFQFAYIKPDTMGSTFIDDDPGYSGKVFSVHPLPASDTRNVLYGISQRPP